ncbi:MAG TPA: hypothetical protein VIJ25_01145, partial [Methylococcales bacterium]
MFLTPIAWWYSPSALPDAYSRHVTKMGMMYMEKEVTASENFINQLLNHKNPYTNKKLKDEPCLAVYEIINEPWYWPWEAVSKPDFDPSFLATQTEPQIFQRDLMTWKQMWFNHYTGKDLDPTKENYADFQCEKMSVFLKRMIAAIRRTGAEQPIASALFETYANKKHTNTGILRAIGQSEVDAVTDGWYPGGFDTLHEFVNQMPAEAQAYQLPKEVRHKAKMIYEWDICRTYNTVIMYPAMARRWRSMGAQICCQFQYDSAVTAQYNTDWDAHYFNYETTPAKAVAFKIAAETFAAIPRETQYPTPADNEIFYGTALSFEHKQTLRVTDDQVFYAHSIKDWTPIKLPVAPKLIMGRGDSPYAEYTGSGLCKLEKISDHEIRLTTTPNAMVQGEITKDFFGSGKIDTKKLVVLNTSPQQFKLKFKDWDINCFDGNNQQVKNGNNAFEIIPGKTYYLREANTVAGLCPASGKLKNNDSAKAEKIKLVFVIDQGFGNGVVVKRDTVGMERIVEALKPLQKYYDVYALFGPHVKDKQGLEMMLDICVKNDMPFMFDAVSSDGMTLAAAPQSAPADEMHGLEISLLDMANYKKRYEKYFAGIRFMEIFGQDFSVDMVLHQNKPWKGETWGKMPPEGDTFFRPDLMRNYLWFARAHKMFVQWSEFNWPYHTQWAEILKDRRVKLEPLLNEFPGLITVTYGTNEPSEGSKVRVNDWYKDVEPMVAFGAKDYGLSDQAWLYGDVMACPIEDMIAWSENAFGHGCRYIQYEPGFYFFNIPLGTLLPPQEDYTKDQKWENRGTPRDSF